MSADLTNACFEFFAGYFIFRHCLEVLKDKEVHGISIISVIFMSSWGYWNLYYYPSLGQWWSFFGGIAVTSANTYWIYLLIKYVNPDKLPNFLKKYNYKAN